MQKMFCSLFKYCTNTVLYFFVIEVAFSNIKYSDISFYDKDLNVEQFILVANLI